MNLTEIERVNDISHEDFQKKYLRANKPVILENRAHNWKAYTSWNWDLFKAMVGQVDVPDL